jgi:hypothetical protein
MTLLKSVKRIAGAPPPCPLAISRPVLWPPPLPDEKGVCLSPVQRPPLAPRELLSREAGGQLLGQRLLEGRTRANETRERDTRDKRVGRQNEERLGQNEERLECNSLSLHMPANSASSKSSDTLPASPRERGERERDNAREGEREREREGGREVGREGEREREVMSSRTAAQASLPPSRPPPSPQPLLADARDSGGRGHQVML